MPTMMSACGYVRAACGVKWVREPAQRSMSNNEKCQIISHHIQIINTIRLPIEAVFCSETR